jgi:predicted lipopolysaccharide heptosyltransferase III
MRAHHLADSMKSGFKNILLIQLGDIGDVVLTTPTLRALAETHPDARISVLVRKPFGNLLAAEPYLHEVVESEKIGGSLLHRARKYLAFAQRLRSARYDLTIDLRTGDRGAIFSYLSGAKVRVGRRRNNDRAWQNALFTRLIEDGELIRAPLPAHPGADQSLSVVRVIGIDTADTTPRLHVADKDQARMPPLLAEHGITTSKFVTINPCSRWKYKEWDYGKWGILADGIWQKHQLMTVLVGAPEDVAAAECIRREREDHVFNFAGKTTLNELSALLSLATLHLGVDSAAAHIAAAVGTPTITLFGPGNWRGWTIDDEMHRVVTLAMPCQPCDQMGCDNSGKSECLDNLPIERVLRSVGELLIQIGRSRG